MPPRRGTVLFLPTTSVCVDSGAAWALACRELPHESAAISSAPAITARRFGKKRRGERGLAFPVWQPYCSPHADHGRERRTSDAGDVVCRAQGRAAPERSFSPFCPCRDAALVGTASIAGGGRDDSFTTSIFIYTAFLFMQPIYLYGPHDARPPERLTAAPPRSAARRTRPPPSTTPDVVRASRGARRATARLPRRSGCGFA